MGNSAIIDIRPLDFPWETQDPFLFCVHHADRYPKGNEAMGPAVSLAGRTIGQDFTLKDGWRMYHGDTVPGFPAHPHRGFETVTVVEKGLVDHADSLGATGRFGNGDVQWMTAGKGVQHSEMFPLLNQETDNPFELFQIWLNLPGNKKFAEPYYRMLWQEEIPNYQAHDDQGRAISIKVVAGTVEGIKSPAPPPDSWAGAPANEVAIWLINLEPGVLWEVPLASTGTNRSIYFFSGDSITVAGRQLTDYRAVHVKPDQPLQIVNGAQPTRLLLLQGRPIGEPVAKYGPFVMNDDAGIQQAMRDYQRTEFGGWPWPRTDHVHPRSRGRFALHADGREEVKDD
jgi:redox-sensitive bicupin YhaK (pirin superfamily)